MTYPAALLALVDAALKGLVWLALAAILTLCMRRASAALRHLIWSVTVAGLLLLPVFSLALPQWRVPWLPGWRQMPPLPAAPHTTPAMALTPPVTTRLLPANEPDEPMAFIPESAPVAPLAALPGKNHLSGPPKPAAVFSLAILEAPFAHFGGRVWAAGACLALLPLATGWWQIRRLTRRSQVVEDSAWLEQLGQLAAELGLRRPVQLRRGPAASMPLTWGAWRPVLLLPADAGKWTTGRRRIVLLHELGHIKRWDWLTQTLAYLACVVYWFNPLAWLAARRMRIEREQACDDLVLACGSSPADYADELLRLATSLHPPSLANFAAVPMARRSSLEGRLLAILDPRRSRAALTRLVVAAATALVVAIAAPVAMLRAAPEESDAKSIAAAIPPAPSTAATVKASPPATLVPPAVAPSTSRETTTPVNGSSTPAATTPTSSVPFTPQATPTPPPTVTQLKVQQAQDKLARVTHAYALGLASVQELQTTQSDLEIAQAELTGDAVAVAEAKVRAAQQMLNRVQKLFDAGIVSNEEYQQDKANLAMAQALLNEAQAATAKNANATVLLQDVRESIRAAAQSATANSTAASAMAPGPQIEVRDWFLSLPADMPVDLNHVDFAALEPQQGVDVLSSPRVTVLPNTEAMVVVGQDVRLPKGDYQPAPVGVVLHVIASPTASGNIDYSVRATLSKLEDSTSNDRLQSVSTSSLEVVGNGTASPGQLVVLDIGRAAEKKSVTRPPVGRALQASTQETTVFTRQLVVLKFTLIPPELPATPPPSTALPQTTPSLPSAINVAAHEQVAKIQDLLAKGRAEYLYGNFADAQFTYAHVLELDPANAEAQAYQHRLAENLSKVNPSSPNEPTIGVIKAFMVTGNVMVKNTDGQMAPLQRNQILRQGCTLLAGANGMALLVFSNGAVVQVKPGTALKIVQYEQAPFDPQGGQHTFLRLDADPSKSTTMLELLEGTLGVTAANTESNQNTFRPEMLTGISVIGVKRLQPDSSFSVLTPQGPVSLGNRTCIVIRDSGTGNVRVVSPGDLSFKWNVPTSGNNTSPHGQPVDGVSITLSAGPTAGGAVGVPLLIFRELNEGNTEVPATKTMEHGEVEVDGTWYKWPGLVSAFAPPLKPGESFSNTPLRLTSEWISETDGQPLHLTPGPHTIRFAFKPFEQRAISNPVEITATAEVNNSQVKATPATTLPEATPALAPSPTHAAPEAASSTPSNNVWVTGAVSKQGPLPMPSNSTLMASEAIIQAGGFTEWADRRDVTLVRHDAAGTTTKTSIDVYAILYQGKVEKDVKLQPHDRLIVNEVIFKF